MIYMKYDIDTEYIASLFCAVSIGITRRRTRLDYSTKIVRIKSSKYFSNRRDYRSVMPEYRRYCHDRTLMDGFRGSAIHKDTYTFFLSHRQLSILEHTSGGFNRVRNAVFLADFYEAAI